MIDRKFIELAMRAPDVFIANYLDNGVLSALPKWCEIENSASEKFPYLTILYLLENVDGFSKDDFCNRYSEQLASENETLKSFVSSFSFFYNKEIDERNANLNRLNNHVDQLIEELSLKEIEYSTKVLELEDRIKKMEEEKLQLLKKIEETSTCNYSQQDEQSTKLTLESSKTIDKDMDNSVKVFDVNGIKLKMKLIKGGDTLFSQNSSLSGLTCHVEDFYYSETLVTQDLWSSVMDKNNVNNGKIIDAIKDATLKECLLFVEKLNEITGEKFRLLTEKEWHYAALQQHKLDIAKATVANTKISASPTRLSSSSIAEVIAKEVVAANRKLTASSEIIDAVTTTSFGRTWEYILDLNAVCKKNKSIIVDGGIVFSTLFNYSYKDGQRGIRLALSSNRSNKKIEFVDLGLSSLWTINESVTYSDNKRIPTPKEARELLKLKRTVLENGSVIRLTAHNGNYIYMHSSWYKTCKFEKNKRFCYNPGNHTYNTIYDKDRYRWRFVKVKTELT